MPGIPLSTFLRRSALLHAFVKLAGRFGRAAVLTLSWQAAAALSLQQPLSAQSIQPASNASSPGVAALKSSGPSGTVDLGPNVSVFDPNMPESAIQSTLDQVFRAQETNQFGAQRNAILFRPGSYSVNANIGFNTQIAGLGLLPDDVAIKGYVRAEADWFHDNGTCNFWRSAENMLVIPPPPERRDRWAVSQAAPFRRMHVQGELQLDPRGHGWSSGGFIADTKVDSEVSSGSQQQYLSRNSEFGFWSGSVWNMVFAGVAGAPTPHFPNPSHTVADLTPVVREKPFLCVDRAGNYQVFVPAMRLNATGTSWSGKNPAGTVLPISRFFIVKAGATARDINAALADGKNLLITPGVYHLDQTIDVTRADTVVLGLGFATFVPDNGVVAMKVADVDGVKLAGLLFDAGPVSSPVLVEIGTPRSTIDHAADPVSLHDVFMRVGGAGPGKAALGLRVNSNNVLIDDIWLWRADHGDGVGWNVNTADNGLIVNGNNVTAYGLFVEHFQKYNVTWNGNGGRTFMFQNEMPYDPPDQQSWMNGPNRGYPAYKVADAVTTHEAWGVGSYCYFATDPSIVSDHGFEVPDKPGVKIHDALTVSLGGKGTITNVVNAAGGPAEGHKTIPSYLAEYPARKE